MEIAVAYAFERAVGERRDLTGLGLVSATAVLQLAPAGLAGLLSKRPSRAGALLGMSAGFAVWAYTSVVPLLVRAGYLPASLLERGPFGVSLLRPEALFGIELADPVASTILWTMLFNGGLLAVGSLLLPQSEEEAQEAERVVDALAPVPSPAQSSPGPAIIDSSPKRTQAVRLFEEYFEPAEARRLAGDCFATAGVHEERMSMLQLADLAAVVERTLASSIGTAAAHGAVKRNELVTAAEARASSLAYANLLAELRVSPAELQQRVDFHRERERLFSREAQSQAALAQVSRGARFLAGPTGHRSRCRAPASRLALRCDPAAPGEAPFGPC
ncbi:MAG: hypothetical protein QM765_36335 [Myxococcales bacterium]